MCCNRSQGSLEYLLIGGGGVLIAVIIVGVVFQLSPSGIGSAERSVVNAECAKFPMVLCEENPEIFVSGKNYSCAFDSTTNRCIPVFNAETTIVATLVDALYCSYDGSSGNSYFYTITDFAGVSDYGGKLYFTIPEAIPPGATIVSATLKLYEDAQSGSCTDVDPLYFYIGTSANCETEYNQTSDNGPPLGYAAFGTPNPSVCIVEWKYFEVAGVIPTGSTDIYIEVRGDDADSSGYRRFDGLIGSYPPMLEITYIS